MKSFLLILLLSTSGIVAHSQYDYKEFPQENPIHDVNRYHKMFVVTSFAGMTGLALAQEYDWDDKTPFYMLLSAGALFEFAAWYWHHHHYKDGLLDHPEEWGHYSKRHIRNTKLVYSMLAVSGGLVGYTLAKQSGNENFQYLSATIFSLHWPLTISAMRKK